MGLGQPGPVEQLGQNLPDALCLVHRHENEPGLGPLRAARKLYGMTELALLNHAATTEKIRQPLDRLRPLGQGQLQLVFIMGEHLAASQPQQQPCDVVSAAHGFSLVLLPCTSH